ncbi:hybrid sensor histidine kinase/response regulator [Phenylobacterium hankyongense]|uniref:histidine kinase n=1 Tax=Phenylobacterium hankyongense TaxID=1813876 RepID=A0A328B7Q4_9CAUL|nr:PAS domain-containing sensor histidine kinase [Phenylobacterium hankyongense]RAK60998.1 hybrid sensor histidine kinase/response regulator [Phenylobacterium hankyongense]
MPALESASGGPLLDALDTGVVVLNGAGRVIVWNEWIAAASGCPTGDALGRLLADIFPSASLTRLHSAVAEALDSGASSLLTQALHPRLFPLSTRSGGELVHNVAVRPVGDKPYASCLVQVFDVTVSAARERVLRERQNARYDAVVDSAPDPILTIDAAGLIQLANPAAARELGYEPSWLIGKPLQDLLETPHAWDTAWRRVLAGDAVLWPIELTARRRDGSRSFLDASASRWQSGSGLFVTTILRDVNARRAAESRLRALNETLEQRVHERTSELERAHEQLRQAQKVEAIGQLTGGIAHDFNNLLTPIVGGLDILQRRGVGDARSQRLIDGALQSAERARLLVHRLLAFARQQPLQTTSVDVRALVQEMLDLLGSTLGPRVKIVSDLNQDVPAAMADANQLEMALLNLAVNGRDAMPDGGTLTVGVRSAAAGPGDKLEPGQYLVLTVTDTGVGMDAMTLSRAVEPFFSTKGIGKGTGLGLSMIHGLAAQLGGGLEIASAPGVGTSVEMWLPAANSASREADTTTSPSVDQAKSGAVLLIDDEDLVRSSTAEMLSDFGYTVIEAPSAAAARTHLSDPSLVLVVTDHLMPGMTGTAFAREVKLTRPSLPVLIISGYADLDDVAPDLPRLAKPFREAELSAALAAVGV